MNSLLLASSVRLHARLFGLPDGIVASALCKVSGHKWTMCAEKCCEGRLSWCSRCNTAMLTDGDS